MDIDRSSYSVAEEEPISGLHLAAPPQQPPLRFKYARVPEIEGYERAANFENSKLEQSHPSLGDPSGLAASDVVHFVSEPAESYFVSGGKGASAGERVCWEEGSMLLMVSMANVRRHNILRVWLGGLKRDRRLWVETVDASTGQAVRFKYLLVYQEGTVSLRVLLELEGQFKVWKEMEVPATDDEAFLEVSEFGNQQTGVKINDFNFHLVLTTPYHLETYYHINHQNSATIHKVEIISQP